jgi:hypothetical protein
VNRSWKSAPPTVITVVHSQLYLTSLVEGKKAQNKNPKEKKNYLSSKPRDIKKTAQSHIRRFTPIKRRERVMCRDDFIEARSTLSMPLKVSRQKKQKKKQHKVILFLFLNIDSTPRPCADCLFIWLACSARYTIFSLFFPTADFTLRSMKLRKKK